MRALRRNCWTVTALCCLLAFGGCDKGDGGQAVAPAADGTPPAALAEVPAVEIWFQESEADGEPYRTRTIVTRDFLRIDDGEPGQDFILLDRRAATIYNVNGSDRSVMVIKYRARALESPIPLQYAESSETLAAAPRIAGHPARHHRFLVNGEACYDVVAVSGILGDAVQAMGEYRRVLASEHLRVLPLVPADMHEACDLAHNVFAPARHLAYGLPIEEWDGNGYRRTLLEYEPEFSASPSLFELPADFTTYAMEVSATP